MSELNDKRLTIRPIRALSRGLDILKELNQFNGASVTDISKRVKLPRTTCYRILETLCISGFAIRDKNDDLYRLTSQVRSLSDGYNDESWIKNIAKPLLDNLGKELVWPLAISTFSGDSMLVRETTDKSSPLALNRYTPGIRVPVLGSSSGRVYLTFCGENEREALLSILKNSTEEANHIARDKHLINKIIFKIKKDGFTIMDDTINPEISMAVPIFAEKKVMGAIVMRFIRSAVTTDQAIQRYVPLLKKASKELEFKL